MANPATYFEQVTKGKRPILKSYTTAGKNYNGIVFDRENSNHMNILDSAFTAIKGAERTKPFYIVMVATQLSTFSDKESYYWGFDAASTTHRGLYLNASGQLQEAYNDDADGVTNSGLGALTSSTSFAIPVGSRFISLYQFDGFTSTISHHDGENTFIEPVQTGISSYGSNWNPTTLTLGGRYSGTQLADVDRFNNFVLHYFALIPAKLANIEGLFRWLCPKWGIPINTTSVVTTELGDELKEEFKFAETNITTDLRGTIAATLLKQRYGNADATTGQYVPRLTGLFYRSLDFIRDATNPRAARALCSAHEGIWNLKNIPEFTVEVWFKAKVNDYAQNQTILGIAYEAAANADKFFRIAQASTGNDATGLGMRINFYDTSGTLSTLVLSQTVLNGWAQVIVTRDRDNNLTATLNNGTPVVGALEDGTLRDVGTQYWGLGGSALGTSSISAFTGEIGLVRLWHRTLRIEERAELYNEGKGLLLPFDAGKRRSLNIGGGGGTGGGVVVSPDNPTIGSVRYLGARQAPATPSNETAMGIAGKYHSYRFKARKSGVVRFVNAFIRHDFAVFNDVTKSYTIKPAGGYNF